MTNTSEETIQSALEILVVFVLCNLSSSGITVAIALKSGTKAAAKNLAYKAIKGYTFFLDTNDYAEMIGSAVEGDYKQAFFIAALESIPLLGDGLNSVLRSKSKRAIADLIKKSGTDVIDARSISLLDSKFKVSYIDEIVRVKNKRYLGNKGALKLNLQFFAASKNNLLDIDLNIFKNLDTSFAKYADDFSDISKGKYYNDAMELATKETGGDIIESKIDDLFNVTYNKRTGEYVVVKNASEITAYTKVDPNLSSSQVKNLFSEVIEETSNLVTKHLDDAKAVGINNSDALTKMSNNFDEAIANGKKFTDPELPTGGAPKGKYEVPDVNDPGPITRQNTSADLLANKGYDVEMLPETVGGNGYGIKPDSNPDFLINGNAFDCYSPETANVRNIWSTVEAKTNSQASRIILNVDAFKGSMDDLANQFLDWPIDNLEELLVIKNGTISRLIIK